MGKCRPDPRLVVAKLRLRNGKISANPDGFLTATADEPFKRI